MRLNSIYLCNFRQHVDTRIEFDTGITGIIGPNGSGKSTILEAIAWALYGTPAARGNRDSIRSYRAGPRAVVKVDLGGDRRVAPAARDEPPRVLPHVFHRTERTQRDGRDGAERARPIPLPRP